MNVFRKRKTVLAGRSLPVPGILEIAELPEHAGTDGSDARYVAVSEFAAGDHFEVGDARTIGCCVFSQVSITDPAI
jgi:hypothetical protein